MFQEVEPEEVSGYRYEVLVGRYLVE